MRTRATVDAPAALLAGGGAVLGLLAMFERATAFNVFDHLEGVVPLLAFQNAGVADCATAPSARWRRPRTRSS